MKCENYTNFHFFRGLRPINNNFGDGFDTGNIFLKKFSEKTECHCAAIFFFFFNNIFIHYIRVWNVSYCFLCKTSTFCLRTPALLLKCLTFRNMVLLPPKQVFLTIIALCLIHFLMIII